MEQNILLTQNETELAFDNLDALLNYELNGETLKDVLMKAEILFRNI